MEQENVFKIDVSVSESIGKKFLELKECYDLNETRLVEKMVDEVYEREMNKSNNGMKLNIRKECLMHMCRIVEYSADIRNDYIKEMITEEVDEVCQLLL